MTLPCWRPRNVLDRLRRARKFPENTCSSSRHTASIAEALIRRGGYPMLRDEAEYCGISIWKQRHGPPRRTRMADNYVCDIHRRVVLTNVREIRADIGRPAGVNVVGECEECRQKKPRVLSYGVRPTLSEREVSGG